MPESGVRQTECKHLSTTSPAECQCAVKDVSMLDGVLGGMA